MKSLLFIAVFLALTFGCPAQEQDSKIADLVYAVTDGLSLKLDIHQPEIINGKLPLIIWLHGGLWRSGSKSDCPATFLLNHGYIVASINYRLSHQALYPAQLYDCKAAIRWLKANAETYSIDTTKIGVWGSAAGGHLAALLGATMHDNNYEGTVGGNNEFTSDIHAVCDWYGPTNFLTICDYPSTLKHCDANSAEAKLLGVPIMDDIEKARSASPVFFITGDEPPFLIMHGTKDMTIPFHQSVELDSALKSRGVYSDFKPLEGEIYGGPAYNSDSVKRQIRIFFDKYVKGIVSVDDSPGDREFLIAPNPADNYAVITIPEILLNPGAVIRLYDVLGNEVIHQQVSGASLTIDTRMLPDGMYYLVFNNGGLYKTDMINISHR